MSILLLTIYSPLTVIKGLVNEEVGITDPKKEYLSYDYNSLFNMLEKLNFQDGDFIISSESTSNALSYYLSSYGFVKQPNDYPLMRFAYKKVAYGKSSILDMPLIYSYYYGFDSIYSRPCLDQVCNMDEMTRIGAIINENPSGWIIIDKDRNRNWNQNGFPLHDFNAGNTQIKFLGSTAGYRGFDIYSW